MKLKTICESWLDNIPPNRKLEVWNKLVRAHQMATSREDRIAIANALYKIDPDRYKQAKADYSKRKKLQTILSPSLPPVQAKNRVDVPSQNPLKFGGSRSPRQSQPQIQTQTKQQPRPYRISATESKLISKLNPILTRAAKKVSKLYAEQNFREAEKQYDYLTDHVHNIVSYELGIR